ncbi:GNAT family N-acyltransferase [Pseudonocardia sp. WMMC193]|uniref:N-acyl amino acid synthase FeeM domain-containing protein n=1 Tax=Pseudonocardia sp. WMMC193 TaxID=2911965 RepID=UPI001F31033B|nr:GNAT family N-acyltransferase [Pseudonocardia sp. WMMC193]MCF7548207.1 GNAT family N-acetyltransferase [Pseudonocardia sp. WMMC193]
MDLRFRERCIATDSPFRVGFARTEEELRDVDLLWRAVYGTECGWLAADAPALIDDRYHPHSTYLLARVAGEPVGTMRVVADSPERLPVEQFVGIEKLRGDGDRRLVEVQRLMVLPQFRRRRYPEMPFGVLAALVKGCLHHCIQQGASHIVADLFLNTPTTPMRTLLSMGFTETGLEFVDTELNEPDRSVALLLQVGELFSRSFRSDAPFYRYLMSYDEVVDVYAA